MRFVLCAVIVLASNATVTSAANPRVVGMSGTHWTDTDTLEIVLWLNQVPAKPMNLNFAAYNYVRRPNITHLWQRFLWEYNDSIRYFVRDDGFIEYDHAIGARGNVSIAASAMSLNYHGAIPSINGSFMAGPIIDEGPIVDASVYTIDELPFPIPHISEHKRELLRDFYGGEPAAAWIARIPMEQTSLPNGNLLLFAGGFANRSYVDARHVYFIPEPSTFSLASLGVALFGMHRLLRRRPRANRSARLRCGAD